MPVVHEDRQVLIRVGDDRDVVRKESPVGRDERRQELVKLDSCRRTQLRPAECQQLTGQAPAALGGAADLLDSVLYLFRLRLGAQQLGPAEYDLQRVVEVVGHAAREPADGVELLRLEKRGLRPCQFLLCPFSQRLFGLQLFQGPGAVFK